MTYFRFMSHVRFHRPSTLPTWKAGACKNTSPWRNALETSSHPIPQIFVIPTPSQALLWVLWLRDKPDHIFALYRASWGRERRRRSPYGRKASHPTDQGPVVGLDSTMRHKNAVQGNCTHSQSPLISIAGVVCISKTRMMPRDFPCNSS